MTKLLSMTMAAVLALAVASAGAPAAEHRAERSAHGHRLGERVRRLPEGRVRVTVGAMPYFYYGGAFYRPLRPGYVVVRAPIGAHVRTLPRGYVTFGIGTRRFFFVDSTYYLWSPPTRDYVVVQEPEGAKEAMAAKSETPAQTGELFAYPNQGQSEEQTKRDRYECHLWAADQSGYDPTYPNQPADLSDDYLRAMTACLVGRGYIVR
jgi:hypothetical protein